MPHLRHRALVLHPLIALLALATGSSLHAESQAQKPNFVILLADDISSDRSTNSTI